jgi:hypothetical protein
MGATKPLACVCARGGCRELGYGTTGVGAAAAEEEENDERSGADDVEEAGAPRRLPQEQKTAPRSARVTHSGDSIYQLPPSGE